MHFMSFSGCIIFEYVVQDAKLSYCCVPCILSHFIILKSLRCTTGSSISRYSLVAPSDLPGSIKKSMINVSSLEMFQSHKNNLLNTLG